MNVRSYTHFKYVCMHFCTCKSCTYYTVYIWNAIGFYAKWCAFRCIYTCSDLTKRRYPHTNFLYENTVSVVNGSHCCWVDSFLLRFSLVQSFSYAIWFISCEFFFSLLRNFNSNGRLGFGDFISGIILSFLSFWKSFTLFNFDLKYMQTSPFEGFAIANKERKKNSEAKRKKRRR